MLLYLIVCVYKQKKKKKKKKPVIQRKGRRKKKKRLRYRGDRIRMAGHHHSFPDLNPTATGIGNLKVHAGIEIRR